MEGKLFKKMQKDGIVEIPIKLFSSFRDYCAEQGVIVCGGAYVYFMGVITAQYAYPL